MKRSTKDQAAGKLHETKGKIKETAGNYSMIQTGSRRQR